MSLDVLERNIINDAIARDVKDNLNRAPSERKNQHVQNVVDAINACGVSFCVWQKRMQMENLVVFMNGQV